MYVCRGEVDGGEEKWSVDFLRMIVFNHLRLPDTASRSALLGSVIFLKEMTAACVALCGIGIAPEHGMIGVRHKQGLKVCGLKRYL